MFIWFCAKFLNLVGKFHSREWSNIETQSGHLVTLDVWDDTNLHLPFAVVLP